MLGEEVVVAHSSVDVVHNSGEVGSLSLRGLVSVLERPLHSSLRLLAVVPGLLVLASPGLPVGLLLAE